MHPWNKALREGLAAGTLASVLSTAALAAAGRRETGHAAAPINAVSHWVWDRPALRADQPSLRYTALGYATHHLAAILWATLYARAREVARPHSPPSLAGVVITCAVAALVDFKMTPARLTPGFEHRVSRPALVLTYGCLALGMLLGGRAVRGRARPRESPNNFSVRLRSIYDM